MFEDLEYKHTAKVSRDAWFLKLWCWAWEMEPERADFCKLFWGYVFMPLNLFIRVIGWPLYKLFLGLRAVKQWIGRKLSPTDPFANMTHDEWRANRKLEKLKEETNAEKKKKREERIAAFFGRVSAAADRVVGFFQATWPFTRWILYAGCFVLAAGLTGGLIWGVIELADVIIGNAAGIGHVLLIVLAIVAGLVIIVSAAVAIVWVLLDTPVGKNLKWFLKRTFGAFGSAMLTGLIAIKTRTCPKIELLEDEDSNPHQAPST